MGDISAATALQPELWTSSANDVLKLFVTDGEGAVNFQPLFTYPIFGDSETIYGYQELVIFLCFDHYTFRTFLNIKYANKLDDPEVEDIKQKLLGFLPQSITFKDEEKWVDLTAQEKKNYNIPGEKIDGFTKDDEHYSIYKIDLASETGLELHHRLQILVLLFIEAGSYIDAKDPRWNLYVVYKDGDEPSITGFTTTYRYWKYPGHENFDKGIEEIRMKISQFIILPNHQGKGLGGKFYSSLFKKWYSDPTIVEIVVEEPNESFDDLRDRNDLLWINGQLDLASINVDKLTPKWIEDTRIKLKLDKRQFSRLLEMVALYNLKHGIANNNKRAVRLFIKRRVYEKNKDGLVTLDEPTRKDKMQTAYETLEQDYYRILGDITLANDVAQPDPKRKKH